MRRGFSLTELLIVVTTIAIIASIGGTTYSRQLSRGRDQQRIADIQRLQLAMEQFRSTHGEYPSVPGTTIADPAQSREVQGCDSSIGAITVSGGCHMSIFSGAVADTWAGTSPLHRLEAEGLVTALPHDPRNSNEFYYGLEQTCGEDDDTLCGRVNISCGTNTAGTERCCAYELSAQLENGTVFRACDQGITIQE